MPALKNSFGKIDLCYYHKNRKCVAEDVKKWEPLRIVGGLVKWCNFYGKRYGSSLKIKDETTIYDLATSPMDIKQKIKNKK